MDALMIFGYNVGWLRLELLLGIIPGNLSKLYVCIEYGF